MIDLEKLDSSINELEKQTNELAGFNKVYSEITKLKEGINNNLKLLKENNSGFSELTKDIQTKLEDFQKKIDEIYKDNKIFQKELDSSIFSRLEKHKTDIQTEIKNEANQIQRSFESTLNSNFDSLKSKLHDEFTQQNKRIKNLQVLMILIILFCIVIGVGVYLK